jgi:transcriptional regulator with XRE-family HTH domain
MSEEQQYWRRLIEELQEVGVTLERIADSIGVSDRQVTNWKAGDRPKGLNALNLYLLHVKHRTGVPGT